jgi:hypothetical protein
MATDRDIAAIATWEREPDGYIGRSTGPRREPPAVCYNCGRELDDVTALLYGAFCSGACSEAHGLRVVKQ